MRVGGIVAAHTLAASLGAVVLAFVAALSFAQLDADQRRFGAESAVSRDLLRVEDSARNWLIMGDLVYGSGETYLAEGVLRQGDVIVELSAEVAQAPLGSAARDALAQVVQIVHKDQERVRAAASFGEVNSPSAAAVLAQWDEDSQKVPTLLAEARSRVGAATISAERALEQRRARLILATTFGAPIYLLMVALSWYWVTRSVVWPLERLTQVAEQAVREGVHVDLPETGPFEVRRLSSSLKALVSNLETIIARRTVDLLDREKHLVLEIEARRASETEAHRSKQVAEEASHAKSDFLARMSHEVRTPLHGILGVTETMLHGARDDVERSRLQIVADSGRHLLKIINEILDFSKAAAGKLVLRPAPLRFHDMLLDIGAAFRLEAERKALHFEIEVGPEVPPVLIGDEVRLRQVITNLLDNAIKFTKAGEVRCRVRAPEVDAKSARLRFEVRDTGAGIEEADRDRIFESFSQVESASSRHIGGTGLGLAIARSLVLEMHGQIGVLGDVGRGSTFWFEITLPVASGPEEVSLPKPDLPRIRSRFNAEVLVVEDNPVNALVARAMLEVLGCRVAIAEDGRLAVAAASKGRYDLVLMDLHMPGMDGFGATRLMREQEDATKSARTTIVALTADAFATDVELCLASGMDGHVAKPYNLETLEGLLWRFCPQRVASQTIANPHPINH